MSKFQISQITMHKKVVKASGEDSRWGGSQVLYKLSASIEDDSGNIGSHLIVSYSRTQDETGVFLSNGWEPVSMKMLYSCRGNLVKSPQMIEYLEGEKFYIESVE